MKSKKASDVMSTDVVTVGPEARLTDAIKLMLRHAISGLPVVDAEGRLVGLVTEHDMLNFVFSGTAADTAVEDVMTRDVISMSPETDLETLVNCFATHRIRRVPSVREGRVVGIVSRLYNGN